jgi:acyl-CoA dehydrogenase family protein 9
MVETAVCKVFCSEMGWRSINWALQTMAGEGYMTENEVERAMRDARICTIVEGANEVIQSFIFAYGGKQLAEKMLGVQEAVGWDSAASGGKNISRIFKNMMHPTVSRAAAPLGAELFLGLKRPAPTITRVHESLQPYANRLCEMIRRHSHDFKRASKHYGDAIVSRQCVQQRFSDSAMWLQAWAATLSKLDSDVKKGAPSNGSTAPCSFERDKAAATYFMEMAETEIKNALSAVFDHNDEAMVAAAKAAFEFSSKLPNSNYVIPESSPVAKGTGRVVKQEGIRQFPGKGR